MARPGPDDDLAPLLEHPATRALVASAPGPCHLVGGAVRDRLLGRSCRDLDAIVSGRGLETARLVAERLHLRLVELGGKDFAAYRLVGEEWTLDLWDRGSAPLEADLLRRDFTINAIALELPGGAVIDPHAGRTDLAARRLRAVSETAFERDPLRVLRLPRFVAQLAGFAAEPSTTALARRAAPRLGAVARERIRDELDLLMQRADIAAAAGLLVELDLYPGLWRGRPGLAEGPGELLVELTALPAVRSHLARVAGGQAEIDSAMLHWGCSFLALPATGGRSPSTLEVLRRMRDAGLLTRGSASRIELLLAVGGPPEGRPAQRWYLHRLGRLWPTALALAGARAAAEDRLAGWEERSAEVAAAARDGGADLFEPTPLLDGRDLQELLGLGPGPEIGRIAAALRRAQVEGRIASVASARRLARDLAASGPDPTSRRSTDAD